MRKNGIPIGEDCLKVELVEILEKIAPAPTYALDEMVTSFKHEILRTPPYHPELQPIETCWAIIKNQMARNCDFTMSNLLEQLEKAFESVTAKTGFGIINKVRKIEDEFWSEDIKLEPG